MSQGKETYDDIFVILTYKNTKDIIGLLESIESTTMSSKCIVVNSYYDDVTCDAFRKIAEEHHCDFIPMENKGYGAGNNAGINYAMTHYHFKRLVISNPDVEIVKYSQDYLNSAPMGVYGGKIKNLKGNSQNPLRVLDWNFTSESNYYLLVQHSKVKFYASVILSKLFRMISSIGKKTRKVFAVHGSFFVIYKSVLEKTGPLFDENIFMYGEEIDIAKKLRTLDVPVYYTTELEVLHKEDGDIGISELNHSEITRKSCIYIHNKWDNQRGVKR